MEINGLHYYCFNKKGLGDIMMATHEKHPEVCNDNTNRELVNSFLISRATKLILKVDFDFKTKEVGLTFVALCLSMLENTTYRRILRAIGLI